MGEIVEKPMFATKKAKSQSLQFCKAIELNLISARSYCRRARPSAFAAIVVFSQ